MSDGPCPFVGRGGLKLRHALDAFSIDPTGLVCADFGCNVGGFTDCLLQAGAALVVAADTGYGVLDWKLRNDPRVIVRERTNALHADPPPDAGLIELVVIDMAWTPQRLCVPAALRWLARTDRARIITLVKPHYEASDAGEGHLLHDGVLPEPDAQRTLDRVINTMPTLAVRVLGVTRSPLLGGKARKSTSGNTEFLALLARA